MVRNGFPFMHHQERILNLISPFNRIWLDHRKNKKNHPANSEFFIFASIVWRYTPYSIFVRCCNQKCAMKLWVAFTVEFIIGQTRTTRKMERGWIKKKKKTKHSMCMREISAIGLLGAYFNLLICHSVSGILFIVTGYNCKHPTIFYFAQIRNLT